MARIIRHHMQSAAKVFLAHTANQRQKRFPAREQHAHNTVTFTYQPPV